MYLQAVHNDFDPDAVWRVFCGPASSKNSGAFARAKWHASPAGLADAESQRVSDSKKRLREPESKNLRAWLRTYRDLRKAKDQENRKNFLSLLGDYLVTVPGTPTVERWLGEIALQELKHRAHKLSGLSAAGGLRLVKVDLQGRRPVGEVLDPVRMLTKDGASVTSVGGGTAVWPASKFAIQAQTIYKDFFGHRVVAGRELRPLTLAEKSKMRHLESKPALGRLPSKGGKTVEVLRQKHSKSVRAGIEAVRAGASEGHLGPLPTPAATTSICSKKQMLQAVQEATRLRLTGVSEVEPEEQPSKKQKLSPIEKQARVLTAKHQAFVSAPPGALPDYVGPRGESWTDGEKSKKSVAAAPGASSAGLLSKKNPKVYWGPGADDLNELRRRSYLERLGAEESKKLRHADIVIVDSVAGRWESPAAFGARLWGKCLVDMEWVKSSKKAGTSLEFRNVFQMNKKFYMSDKFRAQWPEHAELLVKASLKAANMTPKILSKGKKKPSSKKCFTVLFGNRPENDKKKSVALLSDAERVSLPVVSKNDWGLEHCLSAFTLAA